MAHIEKRGRLYRVGWRDEDGKSRHRKCPDRTTALRIKLEVERALAEGNEWKPAGPRRSVDLREILEAFLKDAVRIRRPATVKRHAGSLDIFLRWLQKRTGRNRGHSPELLTKQLLAEFYEDLKAEGLHGRPRRLSTVKKIIEVLQRAWAWAYNEDEYTSLVPPPKVLEMRDDPGIPTVAPTWDEMDACIAECSGWQQCLAIMLRYTGLRVQQVMQLQWNNVDLHRGTLRIRGDLGKTRQERRGRFIPLAGHLMRILEEWGPSTGWLVPCGRREDGPKARVARSRDMVRAWRRAGVREEVWKQRPHHAFRKGFKTGLKRLGADSEAVEYLLGHDLGISGIYTDPEGLPLRAAVEKIPPIGYLADVVELHKKEGIAPT
ncbi:MAG: tyrosine-type recombinase/integrase [Pseudomonadota bacterium]